jgi:RHS repeat-associated protein
MRIVFNNKILLVLAIPVMMAWIWHTNHVFIHSIINNNFLFSNNTNGDPVVGKNASGKNSIIEQTAAIPEASDAQGSVPTQFKDLKATPPGEGMQQMASPKPNNMGGLSLDLPLRLPPGRNGIEPQIALRYNNEGGSSWVGQGFDISLPAIALDTRFGVPRYSNDQETESYLLDGAQLYPQVHRSVLQPRTAEKQFHPRVEAAFRTIIRHGDSPKNYWWEVTDKDGRKSFYGGSPADGGVFDGAIMRDGDGNIGHWALREVRDLDDNFMQYNYEIVNNTGLSNGSVMGQWLYPDFIQYTGHGSNSGAFKVVFFHTSGRPDVQISCHLGFKQVQANLLRRIEIKYLDNVVTSYEFNYLTGAFFKSLLANVIEKGGDGSIFTKHSFGYYNDVVKNGKYEPYKQDTIWYSPDDNLKGDLVSNIIGFDPNVSAIGGSTSTSKGVACSVTVGPTGSWHEKSFTVGGNFGFNGSSSDGLSALVDIDGDGLPDKVYRKDGKLWFRPNISGPDGVLAFSSEEKAIIGTVNSFSRSKSKGNSKGVEGNLSGTYGSFFVGYSWSETTSITDIYFTDFNSDRLIDIAYKGKVYFAVRKPNGDIEFTLNSNQTPCPIVASGAGIDPTLHVITQGAIDTLIDENPLHDMVRFWEAPFDGKISISAPIELIEDNSPDALEYAQKDGVRAVIQFKNNEWDIDLPYSMAGITLSMPNIPQVLNINKGDRVYFRVQSKFDGAYDLVQWDPIINYVEEVDPIIDPNGKNQARYQASDDYVLAAPQVVTMPLKGDISIQTLFEKKVTSDTVRLVVGKKDTTLLFEKKYASDELALDSINISNIPIDSLDFIAFKIHTNSNINWADVNWKPWLFYTSFANGNPVYDNQGNPVMAVEPVVDQTMYNRLVNKAHIWKNNSTDTIQVTVQRFDFISPFGLIFPEGEFTLSAKGVKKHYGSITNRTTGLSSNPLEGPSSFNVNVLPGDSLFIEYHVQNDTLLDSLLAHVASITYPGLYALVNSDKFVAGAFTTPEYPWLGPFYRGWGFFAYNGNKERAVEKINEGELEEPPLADPGEVGDLPQETGDIPPDYDPVKSKFVMLYPEGNTGYWRGFDDLCYLTPNRMSSSRFGEDNLELNFAQSIDSGAVAPPRITKSRSKGYSLGANGFGVGGTVTDSDGQTTFVFTIMDFNRDGYPDFVSKNKIQYTNMYGGLEPFAKNHNYGNQTGESHQSGISTSGSISGAKTASFCITLGSANNTVQKKGENNNNKGADAQKAAGTSMGFSVNAGIGIGDENTIESWVDFNGDGLPDKIFKDGRVALNLGYSFAPPEDWSFDKIQEGESTDKSGGTGISFYSGSISAGVSIVLTESGASFMFQDINGDGLVDMLFSHAGQIVVRINLGNGFSDQIDWLQTNLLEKNESVGESVNGAFTICINIFFFRICFNPSGNIGQGVSRQISQITDMDGDGFPDYLFSTKDNQMNIQRSTIGRTNLLQSVALPLGARYEFAYQRMGNTYDMPSSKWVLSEFTQYDGLTGDGADHQKWTYQYKNGRYDRLERDFLGFEQVVTRQIDTGNNNTTHSTLVQHFDNTNYLSKGLLMADTLFQGQPTANIRFLVNKQRYELTDVFTGDIYNAAQYPMAGGLAFPALLESTSYYPEGMPTDGLSTRQEYKYDISGNIIEFLDFGNGTPEDLVSAQIEYHAHPVIRSTPSKIQVWIGNAQELKRHRETTMDNTGNITQVRQYLDNNTSGDFDMEYDQYGNLIKITRPPNSNGERMFYAYQYDSIVHTYRTGVRNAFNYRSFAKYDPAFGQMLQSTDINGNITNYKIDQFGRIIQIVGQKEIDSGAPFTIEHEYHPDAAVPYAITRHFDQETGGTINTFTFTDGLGRPVQVKKTGIVNTSEDPVMIVSGRVLFDAMGRAYENYYPTTEPLGSEDQFNPDFDAIKPTKTVYDLLDRPLVVTLPDESRQRFKYDIASDNLGNPCFRTLQTDALSRKKETFMDMRGRNVAEKRNGPSGDIWTNFRYNPLSELLEVADDANNITAYTYDNWGQKLSANHPVTGLTTWTYDLAGNNLTKQTANTRADSTSILYSYEFNRLVQIDYPRNFQNRVQYTYGDSTAQFNRKGRLVTLQDGSGGQEFFYGPYGEVVKTIRSVLVNDVYLPTYIYAATFDSWNRTQQLIYPDGEVVDYTYNAAGALRSISSTKLGHTYSIVNRITYDKFGKKVSMDHGNGVRTSYAYEPELQRLSNLTVAAADGRIIMRNAYTYDSVSNVTSVTNTMPAIQLMLGGPSTHTYTYDVLDRLSSASGTWASFNRTRNYALAMTYDNVHNILSKNQTVSENGVLEAEQSYNNTYGYGSPFLPDSVGSKVYTFDLNGNMTGWTEKPEIGYQQMVWDEENRLKGIWNSGQLSQYTYDANGERVIKSFGGVHGAFVDGEAAGFIRHFDNWTAYISPYFVAKEHSFTKHYFIESQRIASRQGNGKFSHPILSSSPGITAGALDYRDRMKNLEAAAAAFMDNNPPIVQDTLLTIGDYSNPAGWPKGPLPPLDFTQLPPEPIRIAPDITNATVLPGFGYTGPDPDSIESNAYFFHSDHLGSTSYVTDNQGLIRQHVEYMPFGEALVEQTVSPGGQDYLFNAKEFDRETGLYYYGARYYDPRLSIWMSADPLAEKYPGWSPYNYTMLNPVKYVDPDGNSPMLVAAVISAGLDLGIQSIEIVLDNDKSFQKDLNWGSVAFSAVTGAMGVGLASKIQRMDKVGKVGVELAFNFAENLGSQYIDNPSQELSFSQAAINAVAGKVLGDKAESVTKESVSKSTPGKILINAKDRAHRIWANSMKDGRARQLSEKSKLLNDYIGRRSEALSSLLGDGFEKVLGAIIPRQEPKNETSKE